MDRVDKQLKQAQKILHETVGDDWNDLQQTLYEGRVLVAMVKFSEATNDSKPCIWKLNRNDDEYLYYETDCGEELVTGEFSLEECNINYCQHCGKKVRLA